MHTPRPRCLSIHLTVSLLLCIIAACPGWTQAPANSLSYWENQLVRQVDSVRKAEVLLFVAKDYEATNPATAIGYAQRALTIGEERNVPRIIGLAALQLAKLHTVLGSKSKARRFRKQAEKNLRDVDLMADLNRLEAQKVQAEEMAQAREQVVLSSQEQVSALSSATQQQTRQLHLDKQQLTRQSQLLGSKDALITHKNQLIGQRDSVVSHRNAVLVRLDSVVSQRDLVLRFQTDQIKLLEQQRALQAAAITYERTVRNATLGGAGLLLLLAGLLWRLIYNKQKTNRLLARKNTELDTSRRRSDELLLNILPAELVNELKVSGITKTRQHDDVTIMFTDFKDFTKISEVLTPTELVREIDHCFCKFDEIIGRYPSIEKIKTIGDSYLCAGGLPDANNNHAFEVVAAALEIRDFIITLQNQRLLEGRLFFQVRIGIHSGPVVAGVVGATKFAYDIWGDTVNTASRLESVCDPGRVNISEATRSRVQSQFDCQYRGKIASKNKAEMGMYFVELATVVQLN